MENKKTVNVSYSTLFLIIALIIIGVMGYFIYQFYQEKNESEQKISQLNSQISDLQTQIKEAEEKQKEKENTNTVSDNNAKKLDENDEDLTEFLSYMAGLDNSEQERNLSANTDSTAKEYQSGIQLNQAVHYISKKYQNYQKEVDEDEVEDAIEELKSIFATHIYNETTNKYVEEAGGDSSWNAHLVKIENQTYANGVYEFTILYAFPSEGDYLDNKLDTLDCYRATIKLKVNDDYEYSKYQLNSTLPIQGTLVGKVGDFK